MILDPLNLSLLPDVLGGWVVDGFSLPILWSQGWNLTLPQAEALLRQIGFTRKDSSGILIDRLNGLVRPTGQAMVMALSVLPTRLARFQMRSRIASRAEPIRGGTRA